MNLARRCLVLLCLCAAVPARAEGSSLLIFYRTAPAARAAFLDSLGGEGAQGFRALKAQGVLSDFLLLSSRYTDSGAWTAMAMLSFSGPEQLGRWREVERRRPGGLPAAALALVGAIETTPAEAVRSGGPAASDPHAVFLAIPYESLVPAKDYLAYLDGYTIPQFDGWMQEGVLAGYSMSLARYPAGRSWNAFLLLRYKDEAALDRRDEIVAKVRARLKDNPEWKAISDTKKDVRNEREPVVADILATP